MNEEKMDKDAIIENASRLNNHLISVLSNIDYKTAGILPSELLFMFSIVDEANINVIIESGRANGYSTECLSSFRDDLKIHSIEHNCYTAMEWNARKRLKEHENLTLHCGDAKRLVPELSSVSPCAVLIDGPKDKKAIMLARDIIGNKNVKFVFIHDMYSGNPSRRKTEEIFSSTTFSDEPDFVSKFKDMDDEAWQKHRKGTSDLEPYIRGGKEIDSYGPTLAAIDGRVENPINSEEQLLVSENANTGSVETFVDTLQTEGLATTTLLTTRYILKKTTRLVNPSKIYWRLRIGLDELK